MLESMRQHSQSFIIYLLFGILIVVFTINFGPGSRGCQGGMPEVASVNGEPIAERDFMRVYSRYYQYLSSVYPGFSSEQAKKMNLRQSVLDDMINKVLLAQEAQKRGLVVTDDELRYAIINDPQFQNEGKFDKEAYENYVTRYNGVSIHRFEAEKRRDILAEKMEALFSDSITVSEQELVNQYKMQKERLRAKYVSFKASDYIAGIVIDDAAAEKQLADDLEAVKAYHAKEIYRYRGRRRVSISRILIPLADDADAASEEAATALTKEVRAKLAAGGDFAALAKEYSKGAEAAKGGAMGFLEEDVANFPFLRAVAGKGVGDIVPQDVVTKEGLNIVKVDELDIPKAKEFDEIKIDVAKDMLKEQKAKDMAKGAAAAWIAKASAEGANLSDITAVSEADASSDHPYLHEGEWITKEAKAIPGVGINEDLKRDLFAAKDINKVLPTPYAAGNNFVAVIVAEHEAADMGDFEENRELIKSSLREAKRRQVYQSWLKEIRDNARISIKDKLSGAGEELGASNY